LFEVGKKYVIKVMIRRNVPLNQNKLYKY